MHRAQLIVFLQMLRVGAAGVHSSAALCAHIGCRVAADAHGPAVASLLRATPLDWLMRGQGLREMQLAACRGAALLVSLCTPPGSTNPHVVGLHQLL